MKYLTFSELRLKLGNRSRSACYLDLEAKRLPPPLKLGGKLYWRESDIDAHLDGLRGKTAEALRADAEAMLAHADALEAGGAR